MHLYSSQSSRTLSRFMVRLGTLLTLVALLAFSFAPIALYAADATTTDESSTAPQDSTVENTPEETNASEAEDEPVVQETQQTNETVVTDASDEESSDASTNDTQEDESDSTDIATSSPDESEPQEEATTTSSADLEASLATSSPSTAFSATSTVENAVASTSPASGDTDEATTSTATTTSISTGDAVAAADIVNVANTSIENSTANAVIVTGLSDSTSTIDTRGFLNGDASSTICGTSCNLSGYDLTAISTSTATVTNDVDLDAATGDNEIASKDGTSTIDTGDAIAIADIVNVINTHIIDSNYLLLLINQFGDWAGNLVLPSKAFFESLGSSFKNLTTNISNSADVVTNASTSAATGNNTTLADDASISTGNAVSWNTILNQINTTYAGDNALGLLFRIHGTWNGEVYGAPDGLIQVQTPDGIEFIFTSPRSGSSTFASTTLQVSNSAFVRNNISVNADTGDNYAENTEGRADISAGDAYAVSNVVNVINTTVLGRNWVMGIVNIFGDWNGNLSFGQPDLVVAGRAQIDGAPRPGSSVVYDLVVANRGDADASNVTLSFAPDDDKLEFPGGDQSWSIGTLAPGETREFSYTGRVPETLSWGDYDIGATAQVSGREPEDTTDNNTERIAFAFNRIAPSHIAEGIPRDEDSSKKKNTAPDLRIERSNDASPVLQAPGIVNYTMTIKNDGAPAYNASFADTLTAPDGTVLTEQSWDLGEIKADEEITLTYAVEYNNAAISGLYSTHGILKYEETKTGTDTKTLGSSGSLVVLAAPQVEEFPATTTPAVGKVTPQNPARTVAPALVSDETLTRGGNKPAFPDQLAAVGTGLDFGSVRWEVWALLALAILWISTWAYRRKQEA